MEREDISSSKGCIKDPEGSIDIRENLILVCQFKPVCKIRLL